MSKDVRVKNLDDYINIAQKEVDLALKEISELNSILNRKKQKLHSLKLKKTKLTNIDDVRVNDSAVLAYFEKVCGFDIQKIRKIIVPPKLNNDDSYLIDGWHDVGDFEVLLRKGRVIDVDVEYEEDDKND